MVVTVPVLDGHGTDSCGTACGHPSFAIAESYSISMTGKCVASVLIDSFRRPTRARTPGRIDHTRPEMAAMAGRALR